MNSLKNEQKAYFVSGVRWHIAKLIEMRDKLNKMIEDTQEYEKRIIEEIYAEYNN